jgi:glutamine synthetase
LYVPRREAEAQAFLDANPDIESVQIVWTDLCGVARGKVLRRDEVVPAWKDGRFLPISALGPRCHRPGRARNRPRLRRGRPRHAAVAVPGTFVRVPWMEKTAQYTAAIHDLDGTPHYADPRNALESVVTRFKKELNMTPVGAVELEFFLMDRASAMAGKPMPPRSLINEARPQHYQAYYLQDTDDFAPFFKDLYAWCEIQDLPAKTLISEYAPGQMEIVLRHRADVLECLRRGRDAEAPDQGLRREARACRHLHGQALFEWTGSGMHVHVSLADEEGNNLFAAETRRERAADACHRRPQGGDGGIDADLRAQRQFLPPLPPQFLRAGLRPTGASTTAPSALRIPAGAAKACHIEHRPSGADANPYLVMAAILAGMHHGISEKADPGNPVVGNGYESAPNTFPATGSTPSTPSGAPRSSRSISARNLSIHSAR